MPHQRAGYGSAFPREANRVAVTGGNRTQPFFLVGDSFKRRFAKAIRARLSRQRLCAWRTAIYSGLFPAGGESCFGNIANRKNAIVVFNLKRNSRTRINKPSSSADPPFGPAISGPPARLRAEHFVRHQGRFFRLQFVRSGGYFA